MKIYNQDGLSLLESWYLGAETSSFLPECDVVVNPTNRFIFNKTVLITSEDFDYTKIDKSNKIISRFPIEKEDYLLMPYESNSERYVTQPFFGAKRILNVEILRTERPFMIDDIDPNNLKFNERFEYCDRTKVNGYDTILGLIARFIHPIEAFQEG